MFKTNVVSICFFFVFLNLAAFLTATSTVSKIKSVEDFRECGVDKQPPCVADFGAKKEGSTYKFFEVSARYFKRKHFNLPLSFQLSVVIFQKTSAHPTFVNMRKYMETHPNSMVADNDEGLRRVHNEDYAYLMESTSLEYYTERICNVTRVGDLIDERNYAIGMRKGKLP